MTELTGELDHLPGWARKIAAVAPTIEGQQLSRFLPPPGREHRQAAVLMLFGAGDDGEGEVLLLERASSMRSHPGQAAFPGGALDPGEDPVAAALREAQEETGLDPSGVQVLSTLPALYLWPSDFAVTPVVAWWATPSPVHVAAPDEVARVERVPLPEVLDPANRFVTVLGDEYRGPGFGVRGLFVWGFTAGLLSRLLTLAGLDRPWDETVERPIPQAQLVGRRHRPGEVSDLAEVDAVADGEVEP
jgi:8-oxo-dGTP pyrophosphatase MutT (NUDIX family)